MGGGSMNYLYGRVQNDATFERDTPERRAFAKHLELVAKALHDIEWVDSGDYGPGREVAAIMACITPAAVLAAEIERAQQVIADLQSALAAAQEA